MIRTVEALIDQDGGVRPLEPIGPGEVRRAVVIILEEPGIVDESAVLSEAALSDWNRAEEDAAWAHLQPDR